MDRSATPAFIAELLQSTNSPCYMVEMYFDDGVVRLTDAWRDISWGGNTFTANGHLLNFSGLTETTDMQIPSVTLVASGIDQAWVSIALTKPYIDRPFVLYKGLLDYTQNIITDPVVVFRGGMDGMTISDEPGGTCTTAITATSEWADFERTAGRHSNSTEQNVWFPGDKFFDLCSQGTLPGLKWGST